jgi:hypothetical protein
MEQVSHTGTGTTESAHVWRRRLLIEEKNFQYDAFISTLPREMWNIIFSLLGKSDLNRLVAVSKSCYHFLHKNIPPGWKSATFDGSSKKVSMVRMGERISSALSLPHFSQVSELRFINC